jgi:hypothetical protein
MKKHCLIQMKTTRRRKSHGLLRPAPVGLVAAMILGWGVAAQAHRIAGAHAETYIRFF